MNLVKKYLNGYGLSLLLICGVWLGFTSCNGTTADLSTLVPPTPPASTDPTPANPPGGADVVDGVDYGIGGDDDFYVGISSQTTPVAHVRTTAGFHSKCAVSSTSVTNQDLTCIVDIPEGDLVQRGIAFKWQAPAGLCKYMTGTPYWFFNQEVGVGPVKIEIMAEKDVDKKTTGTTSSVSMTCLIQNDIDEVPTLDPGCNSVSSTVELNLSQDPGTGVVAANCVYDHSGEAGKANCCMGQYDIKETLLTVTTDETSGTTVTPVTTTVRDDKNQKWGGELSKCIGGPGRTDWPTFDSTGRPNYQVIDTIDGAKGTIAVASIVKKADTHLYGDFSVLHAANYYQSLGHTHTGFYTTSSTALPYFIDPIDDRSGTNLRDVGGFVGQPSYVFQCRDAGFEILHRISVYVRQWDTYPDFKSYIQSEGVSGTADRGTDLTSTTNCEAAISGYYCNTWYEIDDMLNPVFNVGGSNGAPLNITPANVKNREYYFPGISYK
ncbi:MAG: hypothetical protein ACXWQQ_09820 [Pseudobdellovibrio sp.]